jgi:outer membrane protein OmpA-like peptidoglycan-associated protein
MKHRTILVFINLLLFFSTQAQEQNVNLSKGDKFFNNCVYFDAIKLYEKVAQNGYQSVELFQKLGDANFFNAQYIQANNWYQKLFELNKEVDAIYYYRYAQTLKSIGDYTKSNEYLSKFAAVNNKSDIAIQYLNNNSYLEGLSNHITEFQIKNTDTINSEYADFGASVFNNTLIFSSTRKSNKKIDPRTNEYYSSLYTIDLSIPNSSPKYFSIKKRSKFNESSPLFSKDGQTIYLTRGGKYFPKKKSANKRVELKIYTATLNKRGKWKKIKELAINNDAYNCAHPALSPDEKTLYFVSDMPGGSGDTDIYKVALVNHQTVGEAINLGPNINTSGKESYPFVSSNNELYFASNGHLGLGGLDIFKSSINENQEAGPAYNIGKPINSAFDDFTYFKLNDSNTGYFSSNRPNGKGKDDIYQFKEDKEKDSILNFVFFDKETQKPLENIEIVIYDKDYKLINTGLINNQGKYEAKIDKSKGNLFYIKIKAPEYGTQVITYNRTSNIQPSETSFSITKTIESLTTGKDLSQSLIKPIYFSVNKYDIRKDAEVELQKLVEFLKEYPKVNIEIRTHTDSRLSAEYNMKLSNLRANAIRKYLLKNNIEAIRLSTKGLGETQLLNHCANGVPCTELEHKQNRRCEFIITKMN